MAEITVASDHVASAQTVLQCSTVYSATQGPAMHAMDIAAATWAPPPLAAVAARAVGRPVKVAATRQQVYTVTGHRASARGLIGTAGRCGRGIPVGVSEGIGGAL